MIAVNSATEQAQDRYKFDPKESSIEIPEDFEPDKAGKSVSKLRSKIEAMGPINMMAIEEYDHLDERATFISKQREEVQSSVDLLELAIDEIEEHSEEKFMSAFTTLNREFADLFPVLFPGGDAAIVLTNESNPIEGGVEIMVRLPGKKTAKYAVVFRGRESSDCNSFDFWFIKV